MHLSFVDYFAATVAVSSLITFGVKKIFSEIDTVKSNVDGRKYIVQDLTDKQKAADYLAKVNSNVQDLINKLITDHPIDRRIQSLKTRYNPDNISEGSSQSGYTSYSVNKGEKLVICIRQKDGKFADINDVMYVVIHELGHLATDEIGHTKAFWDNFLFILKEAVRHGYYEYRNYNKRPVPYCGIQLSSTILNK